MIPTDPNACGSATLRIEGVVGGGGEWAEGSGTDVVYKYWTPPLTKQKHLAIPLRSYFTPQRVFPPHKVYLKAGGTDAYLWTICRQASPLQVPRYAIAYQISTSFWPWRGNFTSDLILCHKSWIVTHIFIMSFSVSLSGIYPLSCWKIIFFTYGHFPCSPPVSGSIAGRIRNPQYCRSRRHSNANSKIYLYHKA